MTSTFDTTHKDHALAYRNSASNVALRSNNERDTIISDVGSAIVHALLEVASAINDHARDTR